MWDKVTDFLQSHYRGVLAVNLAMLLFIGTAVFYGANAVRDIHTLDEVIVKADLQPTKRSSRLSAKTTPKSRNWIRFIHHRRAQNESDLYRRTNREQPRDP